MRGSFATRCHRIADSTAFQVFIVGVIIANAVVLGLDTYDSIDSDVGDTLSLGGQPFRIAGTVVEEPDKLGVSFTLGPRIFLSPEGLARTKLTDTGARVEYRALLKLRDALSGSGSGGAL